MEKIISETFPRLKIMVVGDIILDHYIWGKVERTSPEAPVPVVNVDEEYYLLGGAANVAHNLAAAGVEPILVGIVGNDLHGKKIISLLKRYNISPESVVFDESRPTILKTRILSHGQQLIRIDQEKNHSPTPMIIKTIQKRFSSALKKVNGVIVSDYEKGLLSSSLLGTITKEARERNVEVFIDPKGKDFSKYRGATCLTPNLREAGEASGIPITDEDTLTQAGKKLLGITHADCIALTRGAHGVALFRRRRAPDFIPGFPREVYDITGAGDTFISHFAAGYFAGLDFVDAAALGNYAAAITVGKLGVATVAPDELIGFINEESYVTKRKTLAELTEIVYSLKSRNKKVVFTNGCFDLLHIGHIKFLEEARKLGDCLIVAINSDASVRRIKGTSRPIISDKDRADILSALRYVDYVVIFDENEPLTLLKALKPDVLVKGKNLKPEEIVGREFVLSYGGEVKRLPFFRGISTDQIIHSIRNE